MDGGLGALVGHGSFGGSFISEGFPPGCPYTSTPFYGSLNLTAAEGDTLYEQISGTVCEVSSSPWTFDTPSTYTITGGTGLFRNATGSGTFDGKFVFDNGDFPFFSTGPTSFTEDGTINLNRRLG